MLFMLLIGWIVLLPALVVAGLYIGSTVLGRRRAALNVYEDLFADESAVQTEDVPAVTPEAITGPLASSPEHRTPAATDAPAHDAPRVGAGY
jgi:hypothetical protein